MLKNLSKWGNICLIFEQIYILYGKKQLVYLAKIFSNQLLYVSIWFKIDRIVHDRPNIEIT